MSSIRDNYIIQAWLVLVLCLFFGSSLAGIQLVLSPKISENKKNETLKKIPDLVLGEIREKTEKGDEVVIGSFPVNVEKDGKKKKYLVYEVKDKTGNLLGFVSKSSGQGYADKIELLAGFDSEFKTYTGLFVLDQKETPGLGNKITDVKWRRQFFGQKLQNTLKVVKTGAKLPGEIDAITGATISSRCVRNIITTMSKDLKVPIQKRITGNHEKS